MEQVGQFFNDVIWFFDAGVEDLFSQLVIYIGKQYFYVIVQGKLYGLQIAYAIAQDVIVEQNITQSISTAYNTLDSNTLAIANFFRIPDFIKNIIAAYATKFVIGILN